PQKHHHTLNQYVGSITDLPLVQAHRVADQVEKALRQRFPGSDVIIHQDPCSVVPIEQQNSPGF
ncbi:cation transporter dimerization domain-containing protein, partial [Pantoea septica]|uniref:cation transporter dimerization domain-containing protein n=1 Tax=Pantoea septica TaxID=472695 RepID=UPI0023F41956